MEVEAELQEVKVSVVYIDHTCILLYFRVLFFLAGHKVIWMKIVSWPSTAETNFKALLVHITKVLAAECIIVSQMHYRTECLCPCLANIYTSCLTHSEGTWSTHMGEQKCHCGELSVGCRYLLWSDQCVWLCKSQYLTIRIGVLWYHR